VSTAEMDFKAKMDNFDYAEFIEDAKNEKPLTEAEEQAEIDKEREDAYQIFIR
jgi:hypothetical protein